MPLNRHEGFNEAVPEFFLPIEVLLESGCKFMYPDIEKISLFMDGRWLMLFSGKVDPEGQFPAKIL